MSDDTDTSSEAAAPLRTAALKRSTSHGGRIETETETTLTSTETDSPEKKE